LVQEPTCSILKGEYTSINELVRGTQVIMSIIASTVSSHVSAVTGEVMKSEV